MPWRRRCKMIQVTKKIVNYLLCLSIASYPVNPAVAEDPVASASKVVEQTTLAAQADAEAYVAGDFQRIMGRITGELMDLTQGSEVLTEYTLLIRQLTAEFEAMSQLDVESLRQQAATSQNLEEFIQRYEETVRKLFMAQWTPVQQEAAFQKARDFIKLLANDFENTCRDGRADAEKSYMSEGYAVPKYVSYFEGKVSLGAGDELGLELNYGIETAGSEQAAKDRRLAIDISTGAAEITASAWLAQTSGMATFSAGSTGAMLAAAAPYMLAVVAVVMIVTSVSARAEAYKMAKKVIKANELLASGTPDHEDVNRFYRDSCKAYSGLFSKVAAVFGRLPKDGSSNEDVEKAEQLKPAMKIWENESNEFDKNICRMNLDLLYKENGCVSSDISDVEFEQLVNNQDSKAACVEDKMAGVIRSNVQGRSCELPLAEGERKATVEKAMTYNDAYNEKYSMERISGFLAAKVALSFQNQYQTQQNFRNIAYEDVTRYQELALEKVFAYVKLIQELRPLSEGEELLMKEKAAMEQFYIYRNQVLELSVTAIQVIFEESSKEKLIKEFEALSKPLKSFKNRHAHIREVRELHKSFERIYKIVGEL